MIRKAFKMKLKEGFKVEYQKRHSEIWPELLKLLKKSGISDYSIYLDEETLTLFACMKLTDNNTSDALPEKPLMRKWWDFMSDIMEVNTDNSPVCMGLKEVFHMD
jgi:L-rhamnose mutarotase